MNSGELAKWLRAEHEQVGELSATLLEKIVCRPKTNHTAWLDGVRTAFEHLRAHLTKHMALEEQGGYLAVVVEAQPTLSGEVEALGREHREFSTLMDQIQTAIAQVGPNDCLLMRDVCHRIQDFLSYIEHHKRTENLLVTSALTVDIGEKD